MSFRTRCDADHSLIRGLRIPVKVELVISQSRPTPVTNPPRCTARTVDHHPTLPPHQPTHRTPHRHLPALRTQLSRPCRTRIHMQKAPGRLLNNANPAMLRKARNIKTLQPPLHFTPAHLAHKQEPIPTPACVLHMWLAPSSYGHVLGCEEKRGFVCPGRCSRLDVERGRSGIYDKVCPYVP